MSNKADRGTKRTCQECEAKFYDLGRSPITCPICGVVFKLDEPEPAPAPKAKPVPVVKPEPEAKAEEAEDDKSDPIEDELAEIESDDGKASTDEDDNTFLETEDDDTNVSDMLGGAPVAKNEEES